MLGVSHTYLEYVRNHFLNKGLATRIHSNTGKIPLRKSKMLVDENVKKAVKKFLENYAETHGLPDPGKSKNKSHSIIFLPTDMSYKLVHRDFLTSLRKNNKLKQLKYDVFRRL